MKLQEIRNQAMKLSVSDKLALVEAIVRSVNDELNPRPPVPAGTLTGLRGLLKAEDPLPTDEEIKEERLQEKYLK